MTDDKIPDWEKKYWANRQQQVSQQQHQPPRPVQQQQQPMPELDITSMLQQRIMSQQANAGMYGNGFQQPQSNDRSMQMAQRVCFLKEGTNAYRMVSSDFGSEIPLVISTGPVTGITGRQFENKGRKRCFLVDSHSSMVGATVDLAKMNESPEKFITLIQVSAPFLGSVLVPENCIVPFSAPGANSSGLLKG